MPPTQQEKGAAFRALHEGDPFVIANAWDAGSAKVLAALGFNALASTSSGFAFTLGRLDGNVTLDEVTEHARVENHIRGNPDLDDTIARLQAYERAGADVLFAPGLRSADEIRPVCEAVSRPVNVLAHRGLTVAEITEAGGQRISVGGALTWVAVGAMIEAAERIRDHGDFSGLVGPP